MTYQFYDDQRIGGSQPEGSVFTLDDRAELDAFAEKYAQGSLTNMCNATASLLNRVSLAESKGDKSLIVRDFMAKHPMPSAAEVDDFRKLRDKAFKAADASMNRDEYANIEYAVSRGMMTDEDAAKKVKLARNEAKREAFKLANGIMLELVKRDRVAAEYPEGMLDDEDKQAIKASFDEFDQWEKTKAAFRERYDACKTMREKAELRAMFPELAKAAL